MSRFTTAEKVAFVLRVYAKETSVDGLCAELGVSRATAYGWLRRYRERGELGLIAGERRPRRSPSAMPEEIVEMVRAARERHSRWGHRAIAQLLERRLGERAPSARTVARILARERATQRERAP